MIDIAAAGGALFGFFVGYMVRAQSGDNLWQRLKSYFDLYSRHRNKP